MLLNFEGLDTIEVSFNASINRHSSKKSIEELERNSSLGKPVTIHVVDTKDDKFELLCQRLITFNNKFSLTLLKEAEQHLQTPITKVEYMNLVRGYQAKYTSSQLMSFCKFKHKTND